MDQAEEKYRVSSEWAEPSYIRRVSKTIHARECLVVGPFIVCDAEPSGKLIIY